VTTTATFDETPLVAPATGLPGALPLAAGRVDLSRYTNGSFDRGASAIKEAAWVFVRRLFFEPSWLPGSFYRRWLLRRFGAVVGTGVVIKPGVKITFPWRLRLGDHTWLGEDVYIHNLAPITLGSHVCVSQRALLCTGNHDYSSVRFDLITSPIWIGDGAWIGAAAWVGPGVTAGSHAVLTAGSAANHDLEPYCVYRGNPAVPIRRRHVNTGPNLTD
jgi:putative colanic acid biosynthesis acetyltransferase WcaF